MPIFPPSGLAELLAVRSGLLVDLPHGSGLEKGQPPTKLIRWVDAAPRRFNVIGICVFITLNVLLTGTLIHLRRPNFPTSNGFKDSSITASKDKLHVLIPASHGDVNLCCSLLGYPTPSILAWDQNFEQGHQLAGGSHMAKVSGVLDYLSSLSPKQDDELVLMMDAYDIHLQLPKSVLTSRYHSTREAAQRRLVEYAGHEAVNGENLQQLILFGSGKRCAPNWPHTVACYAIPNSPLPEDLYGGNTDTVIGHNHWSSVRQRFLNSGYVLGPAGAMRRMFAEAWEEIEKWPETDPFDDGQRFSADVYHGSDQSVFALMYGRQEWVREKLRLKHAPPGTKPRTSKVFGSLVDNALSPSFTHEPFDPDLSKGNPYEFGIYLDFWSEFGHQTINSEWDARWITYDKQKSIEEQVGSRSVWDCPTKVPDVLPDDILNSSLPAELLKPTGSSPNEPSPWLTRPLYTHLCLSQIPIFRHMNGHKEHRENDWPMIWYQPHARAMLNDLNELLGEPSEQTWQQHKADSTLLIAGGAWTDKGELLKWEQLCPSEYDKEIFRDVEEPNT
ncbi:hypothetical protein DL764_002656 [Monosporascus ibericus]|uniref:Uncharacterized protein n=1 Tax=Monosporascus ibericus TaxID=155417 RepID=A0A4Q4TNP6_9PEZI|nr:hypothetical protein DL764_002656 [Monosporascus ibericus]